MRRNHVVGACSILRRSAVSGSIRSRLLCATVLGGLCLGTPEAQAQNATWVGNGTATGSWTTNTNWSPATTPSGIATFGVSPTTTVTTAFADPLTIINTIRFNSGASAYMFDLQRFMRITGTGIENNSGVTQTFNMINAALNFEGSASAGNNVVINNGGTVSFQINSTAGNATINNRSFAEFTNDSSAGNAKITTFSGAQLTLRGRSEGGTAQLITEAGGLTRFSGTPRTINVGSIEGAGDYYLFGNTVLVGGNNLSTAASGVISDCGPGRVDCLGAESGALTKVGTGTLTLSGANTYTGATAVNGGALVVDGSITASSGVTVNSGGTLGGSGIVPTTSVASGGTIAPGVAVPFSTLHVNGNLNFAPGSTYRVMASTSQSDLVAVTGTAAVSGATVQLVSTNINGCGQASYTILTANGGVNGTFAGLTSNVPFLSPTLTYTSNSVVLGLTGKTAAFSSVAQTRNQRGVTAALDASPCSSALVQALLPLSAPQALQAFNALSGDVHPSTASALLDDSRYMRGAVLGRLRQASFGSDPDTAALSLGGPQLAFQDDALTALAYAKSPIVNKAPMAAPAARPDIAFWSQAFGAWGSFDADGNAAALKRDLAGFLTGVDARFGGNWRAGIAAGYTGSRNNVDGRGTSKVESGHVALYGGTSIGMLNLRAGGAYAVHAIDTERDIVFPGFFDHASARYRGGTGQVFGEAGYGFAFGKVAVEPFAGGTWVHLNTEAFNEKGGVAALNGAQGNFEVGYSSLGVRAASIVPLAGGMVLVPRASAAWQHALNGVTPEATIAFQSTGTSFIVAGLPIARDSLLTEAGLDLVINRNATVGVSYVGQAARNAQDHAAKGKFIWRF